MRTLRLVLGDQCSRTLSALSDLDKERDLVLMVEARAECTYVRHHKKKIVLVLASMRHFARALGARGVDVDYVRLEDDGNTGTIRGELLRAVERHRPDRLVMTECGEWRLMRELSEFAATAGVPVEVREDGRFMCSRTRFEDWQRHHGGGRMEVFYREMRRHHGILMESGEPAGGRWNFDKDNRKLLPASVSAPAVPRFGPDAVTREVMELVDRCFPNHFGTVEGFDLPVTARDAERMLADFVDHRLPGFGDWQDAMRTGEATLFHAVVSTSLNVGLLEPHAACLAAEAAWRAGNAPLNAVEGFVRQVLGWREFVRGIYWTHMPGYGTLNSLGAERRLPWFYWDADTRMNCLHQAIGDTRSNAYAHHIQRLMVTGNFALLAGLHPDEVDEWYLVVYADAYEWVEMPNVRGIALHGDGGIMGSKPYAASGAYINRMSDYCRGCSYDAKDTLGADACPFNALYWDFLARHEERFAANPRMAMPVRNLRRMGGERVAAVRAKAAAFLAAMDRGEKV